MAGDEYAKLIHETLAEERRTKDSLQMRGIQVVTTSGGLVALLVALSALAGVEVVDPAAGFLVVLSLAAFVGAAVGGLLVNRPARYLEPDAEDLARLTRETYWEGPQALGARRAAEVRVAVLRSARAANAKKSSILYWAMVIEVFAIGLLAAGIGYSVLRNGS